MSTTVIQERGIPFRDYEVRATLQGTKTQFRRAVSWVPNFEVGTVEVSDNGYLVMNSCQLEAESYRFWSVDHWERRRKGDPVECTGQPCPFGGPGDRLWVRETFREGGSYMQVDGKLRGPLSRDGMYYRASDPDAGGPWRPATHMPRWASRINLRIEGIRVERIQDITEQDAEAEGITFWHQERVGGAKFNSDWCRSSARVARERDEPRPFAATAVGAYRLLWEKVNGHGSWDVNPWTWVIEFSREATSHA